VRTFRSLIVLTVVAALVAGGSAQYTIRPGDTLSAIARRAGSTIAALAAANGIEDPNRIFVGMRLRLDAPAPARPAAPGRQEVEELLTTTARRHGWSPAFVKALAWQESGWNQGVTSRAGAIGVMQVMPDTGRFVSRRLAGRTLDLRNAADNIEAGVLFLDYLYRLTGRDGEATLAGYYQGLASVRRNGMYEDTRRYVANVLALRERFR
jgi:soluble lytic murein transglycosylase-like protein